ncbi:MAG: response regulator transcription factor [Synechococcus sp.]
MRILLVEDDPQLSASLAEALTAQHYAVDVVQDGEQGWQQVNDYPYDLMLLDVALPKMDGLRLCQKLRSQGNVSPILMLTARDTSVDKILGLDSGADVYMVKPFDLLELLAQIRALLRRQSIRDSSLLVWGDLMMNSQTYDVSFRSQRINLTPKEFAILELLMQNGRRVLSRAFIIDSIWSLGDPPEEETVKSHIKSLRLKLRKAGAPKHSIETVYGFGYRLEAV